MARRVLRVSFEVQDKGSRQIASAANRIRNSLRGLQAQANRANAALGKTLGGIGKGASKAAADTRKATNVMAIGWKTLAAAVAAVGFTRAIREVITIGVEFQRMQVLMKAAVGDWLDAGAALDYVKQRSYKLGLVFQDQVKSFAQLTAAFRFTNLSAEDLLDTYEGVTAATAAMQLSQQDAELAMRAVVQIMSKGKVQAEELRGQMGERIVGAALLAAKSLGVTNEEFNKMLETGSVFSDEFMPKFARALKEDFGEAALAAALTTRAAINRMLSAWFEFKNKIAESGALEIFDNLVKRITTALQDPAIIEPISKLTAALFKLADLILTKLFNAVIWLASNLPDLGSVVDYITIKWDKFIEPVLEVAGAIYVASKAFNALVLAATAIGIGVAKVYRWFGELGAVVFSLGATLSGFVKSWVGEFGKLWKAIGDVAPEIKGFEKVFQTIRLWLIELKITIAAGLTSTFKKFFALMLTGLKRVGILLAGLLADFIIFYGILKAAEYVAGKLSNALAFKVPKDDAERLERAIQRLAEHQAKINELRAKGLKDTSGEIKELQRRVEMEHKNIKFLTARISGEKQITKEVEKQGQISKEMEGQLSGSRRPGGEAGTAPTIIGGGESKSARDKLLESRNKELEAQRKLRKEAEAFNKQTKKNIEMHRKFQDALDEMTASRMKSNEQLTAAALKEEETRYRNVREKLTDEFGEYSRFNELVEAAEKDHTARLAEINREAAERKRKQLEEDLKKITDKMNKELEAQDKIEQAKFKKWREMMDDFRDKLENVATFMGDRFGTAFNEIIKGTKDAKTAWSDMIRSMLNDLALMAAQEAFKILFGGLLGKMGGASGPGGFFGSIFGMLGGTIGGGGPYVPALAGGGTAMAGKPHLVGERGPELFIPGRTGTVSPLTGGGLTVVNNVTVEGGSGGSESDNSNLGNTIARMISEQTRSTILKETRPGGIFNKAYLQTARA